MSRPDNHSPHSPTNQSSAPDDSLRKTGLIGLLQRIMRRLRIGADLHRDDLVESLSAEDNAHADSFGDDEKLFLKNILKMRARHVEDVMVHRAQITAIKADASLDDVRIAFSETNHSRLPVYDGTLDTPVGVVHIKDVFGFFANGERGGNFDLKKIIHPALFAPPSMKVADLLRKMQADRLHMALIIDEHGGTSGLVSIEDLVEEIVGEIEDEHEKESQSARHFVRRRDGSIEAPAHLRLGALTEVLGQDLRKEVNNAHADTLGGLVTTLVGHVPQKGERVKTDNGIVIEIRRADPRRVRTVRLYPPQKDRQRHQPSFADSAAAQQNLKIKSQKI